MSLIIIPNRSISFKVADTSDGFWEWLKTGKWEPETFNILERFSDKNKIYVDVGAWIGPTVLYASPLYKRVVCFEPDPVALGQLKDNIEINSYDNIDVVEACLSYENGKTKFGGNWELGNSESTMLVNEDFFKHSAIVPGQRGTKESRQTQIINVNSITLESALKQTDVNPKDICLIKMDIEGGEKVVIPAIREFLLEHKTPLYISLHYCYLLIEHISNVLIDLFDIYDHCENAITGEPMTMHEVLITKTPNLIFM